MRRAVLLLLLTAGCPCGSLPGETCGPPPPDSCSSGQAGAADTVEIGSSADVFTAFHDGDRPDIVVGGQGSSMMGVRLRLTGAAIPSCLTQSTTYEDGAHGGGSDAVNTYQEPDGSYTTRPMWLPGYFPTQFSIHAVAGGQEALVHLSR
jgi:hypothetical protein